MAQEIVIVEFINGDTLESYVQAFVDVKEAEDAFSKILRETFHIDNEKDIEEYLEDGYFGDLTHYSVIIKEVKLK